MKLFTLLTLKSFLLFIFIISYTFSNAQVLEELLEPKCDGKKIEYSIQANLGEYLKNDHNIDKREIYYNKEVLTKKDIGIMAGTYLGKLNFENYIEIQNLTELSYRLIFTNVDVGIAIDGLAYSVQMFTNEVSIFPETLLEVKCGFGLKKNNEELRNELNEFISSNPELFTVLKKRWDPIYVNSQYLDKTLKGTKTLNIGARLNSNPYSYVRDADKTIVGAEVEYIYRFAREKGYQINLKGVKTYEEQVEALKNGDIDIALGFFVIEEDNNDIAFSNVLYEGTINYLVRYYNLEKSTTWTRLYGSIEELNGEKLGIVKGTFYEDMTKSIFPKSEFVYEPNVMDLLISLLREEIQGFLFDEPFIEYYKLKYPLRITYYVLEDKEPNKNGFAFQKNEEGKALMNEFNEFIKTIDLKEIYNKWNVADTTHLSIDTNLGGSKTIKAGFVVDSRPLSFYEGNEVKGFEIDVLYQFAKAKGYNIEFKAIENEERITLLENKEADITGGYLTITAEREEKVAFSNKLYDCNIVLAVRVDCKKNEMPLVAVSNDFSFDPVKMYEDHDISYDVKFSDGQIKKSNCILPAFYNDTILINCTISDINGVNVDNGFEFRGSFDVFYVLYSTLRIDNFLQANIKIKGHPDIIKMGDMSEIECDSSSSSSSSIIDIIGVILGLLLATGTIFSFLSNCW